jgi:hypothetical protein
MNFVFYLFDVWMINIKKKSGNGTGNMCMLYVKVDKQNAW